MEKGWQWLEAKYLFFIDRLSYLTRIFHLVISHVSSCYHVVALSRGRVISSRYLVALSAIAVQLFSCSGPCSLVRVLVHLFVVQLNSVFFSHVGWALSTSV